MGSSVPFSAKSPNLESWGGHRNYIWQIDNALSILLDERNNGKNITRVNIHSFIRYRPATMFPLQRDQHHARSPFSNLFLMLKMGPHGLRAKMHSDIYRIIGRMNLTAKLDWRHHAWFKILSVIAASNGISNRRMKSMLRSLGKHQVFISWDLCMLQFEKVWAQASLS